MLGTSKGSCEMVEYAKSIGVYTIVTDPNEPSKSRAKLISDEYWMIDTSDIDSLEMKCREEKIDGICCGISTFCITSVIELCRRLGLSTYANLDAWHYTVDKYDFKQLCRKNNVPVATDYFVSIHPTEDELNKIKFPVVVKAVDQSANRGMSYCYKKEDIVPAINYAHSYSKNEKIVIERMLKGIEYTAYYAIADGEASLVSLFSDLSDPSMPNKCYALNSTACDKLPLYLEEVNPNFLNFIKEAGIKEGVCWIELMLDEDGHFYVIEMGYRMSGDMMAVPINDVIGFNSYKWLVDIALGIKHTKNDLPINQKCTPVKCGCSYILWSKELKGKVSKIEGLEKIKQFENIKIIHDVYEESYFNENQYLLTFLFTKSNAKECIEIIKYINDNVYIYDENGNDIVSRFTDFKTFETIYNGN